VVFPDANETIPEVTVVKQYVGAARLPLVFITYVSILHIVYGAALLLSESAGHATATANILDYLPIGHRVAGILLFASSAMALWAVYFEWPPSLKTLGCMTFQVLFLSLAAVGAADAILDGRFADGVERSRYFILADQCPAIIAMVVHSYAVITYHHAGIRRQWRD
jgi:hypothetical protein